jgi:hypothetical protein
VKCETLAGNEDRPNCRISEGRRISFGGNLRTAVAACPNPGRNDGLIEEGEGANPRPQEGESLAGGGGGSVARMLAELVQDALTLLLVS